ncbi:MAG TPA: OmpH family outer membrane protein [Amoebophilaceae bacterium]|jgi:outer membrane protein|nr:OmpH family outer membrane protein [Amoebophilaceae bacterium]
MNYKFLSALTLVACIYTGAKADTTVVEQAASKVTKKMDASFKLGYVDIAYVLENLPEAKKRHAEVQSFQKQIENEIQAKYKEYQEKAEAAQQQLDTLTEAQKKQKSMEFNKLQATIEELESQRYVKMERKFKEVMKPLHDRIQEVIEGLAAKHNYTFVLNKTTETGPVLLFATKEFDLSALVVETLKAAEVKQESQAPVVGQKKQAPAQGSKKPVKPTPKKK